jgi:hypothetical protein
VLGKNLVEKEKGEADMSQGHVLFWVPKCMGLIPIYVDLSEAKQGTLLKLGELGADVGGGGDMTEIGKTAYNISLIIKL